MEIEVKYDCAEVDWERVKDTLKQVGMGYHDAKIHKIAFENSQVTVFLYSDNQMIGFGRAISDGAYQAAIYDMAIIPKFQKNGLGKTIMKHIISKLPQCNIILYASPGKEEFYKKLDFRRMKTGMAYFCNADKMKEKGFTE